MIKEFSKTDKNGKVFVKCYQDTLRGFQYKNEPASGPGKWWGSNKKTWADVDVWAKISGMTEIGCYSGNSGPKTQVNPALTPNVPTPAPISSFEIQEYFNAKTNDFISYRQSAKGDFTNKEGRATIHNKRTYWRTSNQKTWDDIDKDMACVGFKPIMQLSTMAAMQGEYSVNYLPRQGVAHKSLKDFPPGFEITLKEQAKASKGSHKCTCPPEFTSLLWGTGCKCGGV